MKETMNELLSTLNEFGKTFALLLEDVKTCYGFLQKEDNQFWRRVYIRSAFALFEGFIFRMKQIACDVHKIRGDVFTDAEIAFLSEEFTEAVLNDKGEVNTLKKKRFIAIEGNLKFAFKAYSRAFKSNYTLNLGDDGWEAFKYALQVRHRLTHPKNSAQLLVSDEDLLKVEKGFEWFRKETKTIIESGKFENIVNDILRRYGQEPKT